MNVRLPQGACVPLSCLEQRVDTGAGGLFERQKQGRPWLSMSPAFVSFYLRLAGDSFVPNRKACGAKVQGGRGGACWVSGLSPTLYDQIEWMLRK
jgi:hypothetical protein